MSKDDLIQVEELSPCILCKGLTSLVDVIFERPMHYECQQHLEREYAILTTLKEKVKSNGKSSN